VDNGAWKPGRSISRIRAAATRVVIFLSPQALRSRHGPGPGQRGCRAASAPSCRSLGCLKISLVQALPRSLACVPSPAHCLACVEATIPGCSTLRKRTLLASQKTTSLLQRDGLKIPKIVMECGRHVRLEAGLPGVSPLSTECANVRELHSPLRSCENCSDIWVCSRFHHESVCSASVMQRVERVRSLTDAGRAGVFGYKVACVTDLALTTRLPLRHGVTSQRHSSARPGR